MPGDIKLKYGTAVSFSVTALNSLLSSGTNVAGWSTASVDNTSALNVDYLVGGTFTLDNSGTVTAGKSIKVYAYAAFDTTPTWPDLGFTEGSEGAASVTDEEERDSSMRLLWAGVVDTSLSAVHNMPPTSIAAAFGGMCPAYWCLWVVQDTNVALESTGNSLYRLPVMYQYT